MVFVSVFLPRDFDKVDTIITTYSCRHPFPHTHTYNTYAERERELTCVFSLFGLHMCKISAFRLLSSIPTFILHCSNDPWFPQDHADDISIIDKNIRLEWCPICKHDFIVYPHMVPIAIDFCIRAIRQVAPVSKL